MKSDSIEIKLLVDVNEIKYWEVEKKLLFEKTLFESH